MGVRSRQQEYWTGLERREGGTHRVNVQQYQVQHAVGSWVQDPGTIRGSEWNGFPLHLLVGVGSLVHLLVPNLLVKLHPGLPFAPYPRLNTEATVRGLLEKQSFGLSVCGWNLCKPVVRVVVGVIIQGEAEGLWYKAQKISDTFSNLTVSWMSEHSIVTSCCIQPPTGSLGNFRTLLKLPQVLRKSQVCLLKFLWWSWLQTSWLLLCCQFSVWL